MTYLGNFPSTFIIFCTTLIKLEIEHVKERSRCSQTSLQIPISRESLSTFPINSIASCREKILLLPYYKNCVFSQTTITLRFSPLPETETINEIVKRKSRYDIIPTCSGYRFTKMLTMARHCYEFQSFSIFFTI